VKLRNQRPLEFPLCKDGNVRERRQIVIVEMNQIRPVAKHLSHDRFGIVIVAKTQKGWKPEPNRKNLHPAHIVELVRLSGIDVLMERVKRRLEALLPIESQVLKRKVMANKHVSRRPTAESLVMQKQREHFHQRHLSFFTA